MTCNERVPLHSRMKKAAILCATIHFYCVSKLQCEIVKCGFKNVFISNKLILWQSHNILIPRLRYSKSLSLVMTFTLVLFLSPLLSNFILCGVLSNEPSVLSTYVKRLDLFATLMLFFFEGSANRNCDGYPKRLFADQCRPTVKM